MLQGEALGRFALGELAASTALALAAAQGSYAITWQNATSSLSLPAETGTLTITGQSANMAVSMPADAGSYAITGQAAGLISTLVLTATPFVDEAKVQFGFAALGEVGFGQLSAITARTFAINWQSAAVSMSIPADTGTYTITGQDASLFLGRIISPTTGTYAITGYPAVFQINMPAQTGFYTITGQAFDLVRRIPKIRAFPRVGNSAFSATSRGRDTVKIRAFGG